MRVFKDVTYYVLKRNSQISKTHKYPNLFKFDKGGRPSNWGGMIYFTPKLQGAEKYPTNDYTEDHPYQFTVRIEKDIECIRVNKDITSQNNTIQFVPKELLEKTIRIIRQYRGKNAIYYPTMKYSELLSMNNFAYMNTYCYKKKLKDGRYETHSGCEVALPYSFVTPEYLTVTTVIQNNIKPYQTGYQLY